MTDGRVIVDSLVMLPLGCLRASISLCTNLLMVFGQVVDNSELCTGREVLPGSSSPPHRLSNDISLWMNFVNSCELCGQLLRESIVAGQSAWHDVTTH